MKRFVVPLLLLATLTVAFAACAVDVPRLMRTDSGLQSSVIDAIAADSMLASAMVEHLLGGEDSRQALLDKVFSHGSASQQAMMMVATDKTRLDGVLALAVQDSATHAHVMTLLRGMQMVEPKSK